jgi:tetratricopeptide (TPR) repeat protein
MPPFPPVTNRALSILLAGAHRTGTELAARAGLKPGTISAYTSGRPKKVLSMDNLFRFAALLGIKPPAVLEALLLASHLGPDAEMGRAALIAKLGRLTQELVEARLPQLLHESRLREDRRRARELWKGLSDCSAQDWRTVLTEMPKLVSWAVCETLCERSEQAASDDVDRALELAELALWVAGQVEDEPLRRQCVSWARGFLGNTRRVRSELRIAEEEIDTARRLWQECEAGAASHPLLLDGSRLLDLQASLRIDQRRLTEARDLLARAAVQAAPGLPLARVLIKDSYALELMGAYGGAVELLRRASRLLPENEVRLRWVVRFNWMVNLCHLGAAAEAGRMLPGLRTLAARIGYGLDQVRLRWLEGRIDAGTGQTQRAVEALSSVRAQFADKQIRYDEALVSLELAGLYLQQRRTEDVKRLVRLMAPVFEAEGVHEEAQKALGLFRRAVELEALTLELVRRLVAYLYRAQHNPDLRFEETL